MSVILSCENVVKRFTLKPVLEGITCYIEESARIGIVGINGTGKSTFLKIAAGLEEADGGTIQRRSGLTVAYLPQMPDYREHRPAWEQVLLEAPRNAGTIERYEAVSALMQMGISDADTDVATLSGGQKKRVAMAAALIRPVDLLILDEPTNHLDAATVQQLEERLSGVRGAILMVTHDRYFLDRICNVIYELDKGHLYIHEGNYSVYLEEKAARLENENAQARKRSAILRRELEWIRRGAQARSTKQKARIERFEALSGMRGPQRDAQLSLESVSRRLGRKIIECEGIALTLGGQRLFEDFTYTVLRDERMAIVGPNGCGKTSLLSVLVGERLPDAGTVTLGDTVKIGYFRQEFPEIPENVRVIDYLRGIAEYVETREGRLSASQMLERFLFPMDVQLTPVSRLSGGERRRLYLCGILMEAPNVLILDEPTNDLDISTLEVLENYLEDFEGAVLTVSHDRYFVDRVTNRLFAFEDGGIYQYVCSFSDYLDAMAQAAEEKKKPAETDEPVRRKREHQRELRMTFREAQDYREIDGRLAALNARVEELDREMAENASDYVRLTELAAEKEKVAAELEAAEERWLYLTDLAERIESMKNA
ncbi:MAG: ABC-F family ATP-binding cassette domain-containing protein [Clostridia bacterium]|nr:ABC-F family ATP-binding cassette domain-containing protein [Clostridia bacterium]